MKKNEKQPGNDGSDERTVTPYATSISHCSILTWNNQAINMSGPLHSQLGADGDANFLTVGAFHYRRELIDLLHI